MLTGEDVGFTPEAIVIGGSVGAIEALSTILPAVSVPDIPLVVVVHLLPRRRSLMPALLGARMEAEIREPDDKEPVRGGTIWFAPSDYHLLVERERVFSLSVDEPVRFSRPSIDVLFESAADAYGGALAAVVLTGANEDGAAGARAVRRSGGFVVVQDPREAEASAMPRAAIDAAEPQLVLPLQEIATWLGRATIGGAP
jgi:two-component system chemotaxis response regulator CheB